MLHKIFVALFPVFRVEVGEAGTVKGPVGVAVDVIDVPALTVAVEGIEVDVLSGKVGA